MAERPSQIAACGIALRWQSQTRPNKRVPKETNKHVHASSRSNHQQTIGRGYNRLSQEEQELTEKEQLMDRFRLFRLTCRTHLGLFEVLHESYRDWRRRVFRGEEPFSAEVDRKHPRWLPVEWLAVSDEIRGEIAAFQQHGVPIDEDLTTELQTRKEKARGILAEWRPPELSTAVGMRTCRVTREEAEQMGLLPPNSDSTSSR